MVFADRDDADAGQPSLRLYFQYAAGGHSPEEAGAIISRLAAAYMDALQAAGIRASAMGDPIAQINNLPSLFLALILIKSGAAAFAALFFLSVLNVLLPPRRSLQAMPMPDRGMQAFSARLRGMQKLTTVFIAAALIFLAGSLGLILCNIELLTKSEYASYPPPSVLMGQPVSVTPPAGSAQAEYDWKTIPQSPRFILSLLRREDPDISDADARAYMRRSPMETKLMRGEQLGRLPGGWHFTMRVAAAALGQRDAASDRWLSERFWQVKTSYESFLAADGLALSVEGEPYTIDQFPPARAHTRARSLIAFGLCCLIALGWCAWRAHRLPKSISSRS